MSENEALHVAVVGTGRMGGAMVDTLHRAGFGLSLWNRSSEKAAVLAEEFGAKVARTPGEAAAGADVVVTSLADDEAVRSVYLEPDGVPAGVSSGTTVLETSTIDPEVVHEVGAVVDATGAVFLDSPVSGSVSVVEQGALTFMVGGDPAGIESAGPVFDALGSRVIHTGTRGTGAATKLAVNALVHGINMALSEALVLAEKAGVDRKVAYEVFASGAGAAPFVHYKRAAFENPEEAGVAFSMELVAKDLNLITGLGRRVGAPMDSTETGLDIVNRAIAAGLAESDMSAVATFLRGET